MPSRIEDYALIGDGETAALVGRDGSIDWLCWPRFDSPACFAALLGSPENGRWLLAPIGSTTCRSRRYRDGTMILETCFETDEGSCTVVDFMPIRGSQSDLVRMVIGQTGRVRMHTQLIMRFDYGSIVPWVTRSSNQTRRLVAGPDLVTLRTTAPLHGEGLSTVGTFDVVAGETVAFVLTWSPSHLAPPRPVNPAQALVDTERFWCEWSAHCTYHGPWREIVHRSLLTLKALIYHPTGGIVAAPTTSLPEQLGGTRNWDYRYCWLRDATLTLLALMDAGYYGEAAAWRDWLLRAIAGSPSQAQIMYGIRGERMLQEWEIPWLAGYEGARPVRTGNAAHAQLQLDVFGEVMDCLHQARRGALREDGAAWNLQCALTEHVEQVWTQADQGLWEVRSGPQHFTHSKVMAWVAVDRAIQGVENFGLEGPVDRWRALRAKIHSEVCERGYSTKLQSFVQAYGSELLDASCLLIPLVGFLPPSDPRVQGTVRCIEDRLMRDGLVRRYDTVQTDDGLPPGEGSFLACSFWLADNYILMGRDAEARALFERLIALRNDVGLLSEEYDVRAGRQVGNFPQAFSHVALVDTAINLSRQPATPAEQRAR